MIGNQTSVGPSDDARTSYIAPLLINISETVHVTRGREIVEIRGRHFGPVDSRNVITMIYTRPFDAKEKMLSYRALNCEVMVAHVSVNCSTAPGVGRNFRWISIVGGQHSPPSTFRTRYVAPRIQSFFVDTSSGTLATTGGERVVFRGTNMGPAGSNFTATYENPLANRYYAARTFVAPKCNVTTPHVEVTCLSAPGVGVLHYWQLAVGNQSTQVTNTSTSYTKPSITNFEDQYGGGGRGLDTSGGTFLTIIGLNFGPPVSLNVVNVTYRNPSLEGEYGNKYDPSSSCSVTSHTTVLCQTLAGSGKQFRWTINVGGQRSALTSNDSYTSYAAGPRIDTVRVIGGSVLDTAGGTKVNITGGNFGPTTNSGVYASYTNLRSAGSIFGLGSATYNATSCAVTVESSEIVCVSAPGVGFNQSWKVKVAGVTSEQYGRAWSRDSTAYGLPVISSFGIRSRNPGLSTDGGDVVNITGTNFGPESTNNDITATYENPSGDDRYLSGHTFEVDSCVVTVAHTRMSCTTTAGVGTNHKWRLTVGGQEGPFSVNTTRYRQPSISAFLMPDHRPDEIPTVGGPTIIFKGDNFGPVDSNGYPHNDVHAIARNTALFGLPSRGIQSDCNVTVNHTEMKCAVAAGVGHRLKWLVDVGAQESEPWAYNSTSYRIPNISSVVSPSGLLQTTGNESVLINGTDFGPDIPKDYKYLAGFYHNDALSNFAGSTFKTMRCRMLVAHISLQCWSAEGVGYSQYWWFSTGGQNGSTSADRTSYIPPNVTRLVVPNETFANFSRYDEKIITYGHSNLRTEGGDTVWLIGTNFGPVLRGNVVGATYRNEELSMLAGSTFNASGCEVIKDHSVIRCRTSAGVGHSQRWRPIVGEQTGVRSSNTTSYYPPLISGFRSASLERTWRRLSTRGNDTVTIIGEQFGPAVDANKIFMTYHNRNLSHMAGRLYRAINCSVTQEHTEVKCRTVEGVGSNHSWQALVGDQSSALSSYTSVHATTSYTRPSVLGVGGTTLLSTRGLDTLIIRGKNFGPVNSEACAVATETATDFDRRLSTKFINSTPPATKFGDARSSWSSLSITSESSGPVATATIPMSMDPFMTTTTSEAGTAEFSSGGMHEVLERRLSSVSVKRGADRCNPVFGIYGYSPGFGLRNYRAEKCNVTVAHEEIQCFSVPGVGHSFRWKVQVGEQVNNPLVESTVGAVPNISYLPPDITSITPNHGPSTGSTFVRVRGQNMGAPHLGNATIVMNDTTCDILAHDHELISCVVPAIPAAEYHPRVFVGDQFGNATTFHAHKAARLIPDLGPIRGGTKLRLEGVALADSRFIYLHFGGTIQK
jgi:hypothetical protein